jgi:cytochrome c-type biogenesis protein CcsB
MAQRKNEMLKKIIVTFVFVLAAASAAIANINEIPIQHHGRVKPFAAFAQETLQLISGKTAWQGQDAVTFILSNSDQSMGFLEIPFIRVDHPALKKLMSLPAEKNHFSYTQLKPSFGAMMSLVQNSSQKRNKDNRPSVLEQQAELVYQRINAVSNLTGGEILTVIPAKGAWLSPLITDGAQAAQFKTLLREIHSAPSVEPQGLGAWLTSVNEWLAKDQPAKIRWEAFYYKLQPFHWAWIFYILGFAALLITIPVVRRTGPWLIAGGFIYHTAGLLLRWVILARPPVANMYETMIFMDWVLMVTVGFFVLLKKRTAFLSSGALVSALIMMYAKLLPVDQSLDVLTPVLRSSYWLTIHVITIISSYSLFAFAMAVSHRHLFLTVTGKMPAEQQKVSGETIERLLQAGVIALGAGTILGGIWANEAWGRFWGWDPKETWAFITFLGYMAIGHLRYKKNLSDFGLAVGSILGFLLVVMTWYGVNFVLGRGMHSYGSGSGGIIWIVYFLIFEALFLGFVAYKKSGLNLKS